MTFLKDILENINIHFEHEPVNIETSLLVSYPTAVEEALIKMPAYGGRV